MEMENAIAAMQVTSPSLPLTALFIMSYVFLTLVNPQPRTL
jgi:hypothetical protein